MLQVRLKKGRERALLRGHPWVFAGSIEGIGQSSSEIIPGETCKVLDARGNFLAWGAYNPNSKIRIRIWTGNKEIEVGPDYLRARLEQAIQLRRRNLRIATIDSYRLAHAESDGLPGLIIDRYDDIIVVQFLSASAEFWREVYLDILKGFFPQERIYERSDVDVRGLEGLSPRRGLVHGNDDFEYIQIQENQLKYWVDIRQGQKTGFFLDQRDNRVLVREIADEKSVLDCFAYTGGFTIPALVGGARNLLAIEISSDAISLGKKNIELNNLFPGDVEWLQEDVFQSLRRLRDQNRKFDLVILDPPKFAPTSAHAQRAARGYKDINLLGMKLLNPGGYLVTFSCSGGVSEELFQKIVAGAARDAGVDARILKRLGPGVDHPVSLNFPEGAYLKGFLLQV